MSTVVRDVAAPKVRKSRAWGLWLDRKDFGSFAHPQVCFQITLRIWGRYFGFGIIAQADTFRDDDDA